MPSATNQSSSGYLIGLGATVLLSFAGILISYLNRTYHLPSLVLAFWRDFFVAVGLAVVFMIFSRRRFQIDRSLVTFFVLYGLSLSFFNAMWTFSVEFNGAAVATVLAFSSPAITAVLAHYLLDEEINTVKVISILLSLSGIVLVSGAANPLVWKSNAAGITYGLLTGFSFACYSVLGKTSANRSIDPWTTMLYGFSSAIVFLFIFNILGNAASNQSPLANFLWLGTSIQGWAVLILLSLGSTIGGFGLYLVSLGYLPATIANLVGALEPAFTTMWAFLLFHEQLTVIQVIGSLLVLASVILLRFGERGSEPAVAG